MSNFIRKQQEVKGQRSMPSYFTYITKGKKLTLTTIDDL